MNVRLPRLVSLLLLGVATTAAREFHAAPPIERVTRAVDVATGKDVTLDALVAELARADVVFLGETHLDETTHRLELELYRRLLDAREGKVVLAMEMFARDVQPVLDDYLAGRIPESEFLEKARPWGNYGTAYRRLVEHARENGLPVVASNAAPSIIRKVAFGGEEAWKGLGEKERALVPAELRESTEAYWKRVENATRGHRNMLPATSERRYSTQSLWDNHMGEACARALERRPGWLVLHVNGGFHSQWHDGTVRQLALRKPEAIIRTVDVRPVGTPASVDVSRAPRSADYLVLAEARAADLNEGKLSVRVGRDLDYHLHVPANATPERPFPLLIWLPDDGPPAADELRLWRQRLGDEAIVAVVEPLHRERQEDLSLGGRWFWPEDFFDDVPEAVGGVDEVWGYLLRNVPVDAERVVVAGEGVGATVAMAVSVHADSLQGRVLAFAPRRHGELRDLPLPLPESRLGPQPRRSAEAWVPAVQADWWQQELTDHRASGFEATSTAWPEDPWERERRIESEVRAGLGLAALEAAGEGRAHVLLETDTPLARNWARRIARAHAAATRDRVALLSGAEAAALGERLTGSQPLALAVEALAFADGKRLPRAPGPFGGTTLVVLLDGMDEDERQAWRGLVEDQVLEKQSRFHRLRVAELRGERSVAAMLDQLQGQGRRNVLIVPAVFAASPEKQRAIRAAAKAHEDDMTLHYRPGLGSALAAAP